MLQYIWRQIWNKRRRFF